jgi:5-methylcytosine-specific restriction endonuclease McrA
MSKSKKGGKSNKSSEYKKKTIPKALREQVWIQYVGAAFDSECTISWCKNKINVFDFHVGHNTPESKGGTLSIDNLRPICSRCNHSMGANYSIDEWENTFKGKEK